VGFDRDRGEEIMAEQALMLAVNGYRWVLSERPLGSRGGLHSLVDKQDVLRAEPWT
jgi:hypothetical protein